ncbi:class I SAM-dependent methyltransferase [Enterovibrio calviensis]|uniref:class I SAM-dependent methyltransferase n=1 Tax=Enterovibrio calviensis TaxID=91359 RepID=UPI0004897C59|nr:class I SAM-dependent methyltransferase [Enterovibrio calviensis]
MSEQYSVEVSKHYSAYRPPIHDEILKEVLLNRGDFTYGLDIGCGTGVSSLALSKFCENVVGIDPSEAMLAEASQREHLSYIAGTGDNIPLDDDSVDIVSFAGSLSYAKSDSLVGELLRVCRTNAWIVAYDFEVRLDDSLNLVGVSLPQRASGYNHAENFDGYREFKEVKVHNGKVTINVSSTQLAHVLFSSSRRYLLLTDFFGSQNTFKLVVDKLTAFNHEHKIDIDTYYSIYQINAL